MLHAPLAYEPHHFFPISLSTLLTGEKVFFILISNSLTDCLCRQLSNQMKVKSFSLACELLSSKTQLIQMQGQLVTQSPTLLFININLTVRCPGQIMYTFFPCTQLSFRFTILCPFGYNSSDLLLFFLPFSSEF